jgi:hypothetical protein
MPGSSRRTAPVVLAVLAAAVVAGATGVQAASPSPSMGPSEEPREQFDLEAWLDAPVPAAAAPGSTIHVGAFVWVRGPEEPVRGASFRIFLHPASGSGEPGFDYAYQDFAGHLVADIGVPEGGAGELEILLPGTVCENDVCGPRDTPIPILGVGPPPGVPLTALATAVIGPPVEAIVAGAPTTIDITVQPRIRWPAPGLQLPASIWLQVRQPQGPILDDVAASLVGADTGRYEAAVTFDRAGEPVIQAGVEEGAEGADLFAASVRRVTVEAGSTATPALGGPSGEPPAWVLAALVGLLILGLAIAVLGRGRAGGA